MTTETTPTNALLWLGDADNPMEGEIVFESEPITVAVERTDVNEVAVHATMPGDNNALVSLYLSRGQAALIGAQLLREAGTDPS